jgi:Nitroreductase family
MPTWAPGTNLSFDLSILCQSRRKQSFTPRFESRAAFTDIDRLCFVFRRWHMGSAQQCTECGRRTKGSFSGEHDLCDLSCRGSRSTSSTYISREAKAHMLKSSPVGLMSHHFQEILNDPNFDIFYGAPALIVISTGTQIPWAVEDCALAAENLMLAARGMGLGTCWIGFAGSVDWDTRR